MAARDNLKRIKGVGPAIERTLNELGIFSFRQIAEMSEYDIDRVANRLRGFRSRIYREDWVGQARALCESRKVTDAATYGRPGRPAAGRRWRWFAWQRSASPPVAVPPPVAVAVSARASWHATDANADTTARPTPSRNAALTHCLPPATAGNVTFDGTTAVKCGPWSPTRAAGGARRPPRARYCHRTFPCTNERLVVRAAGCGGRLPRARLRHWR